MSIGTLKIKVIHTPGHTSDSFCILAEDALFTGDTLFRCRVGKTWSEEDSRVEYKSLNEKIMCLDDRIKIFPGHDYGDSPVSTIGYERKNNPYLLAKTIAEFLELKSG